MGQLLCGAQPTIGIMVENNLVSPKNNNKLLDCCLSLNLWFSKESNVLWKTGRRRCFQTSEVFSLKTWRRIEVECAEGNNPTKASLAQKGAVGRVYIKRLEPSGGEY